MEDMTPNKRQTSFPTKSLTTPTEKRTQKKRKQDDSQSTHVTMEIYNNLKRTINKMDNEMNEFSKRYSVERSVQSSRLKSLHIKTFLKTLHVVFSVLINKICKNTSYLHVIFRPSLLLLKRNFFASLIHFSRNDEDFEMKCHA